MLNYISFWRWLFRKGVDSKTGLHLLLINYWSILHIIVAIVACLLVDENSKVISSTLLLPFSGVIVGLSFAWAGNALSILQTKEVSKLMERYKGNPLDYIYLFQLSILIIVMTLIGWAIAGLGMIDNLMIIFDNSLIDTIYKGILFFLTSLSIRECWSVVLGTNGLLIAKIILSQKSEKDE